MKFRFLTIHTFPFIAAVAVTLGLLSTSCNLTKEVDIDLPDYDRQPVVECYLEPGKPFTLLLTQSFGFFEPFDTNVNEFLQNVQIQGALVTITHAGGTDTLYNEPYLDFATFKFYNYHNTKLVPATVGENYQLNIVLPDGKTISAQTTMLPRVPIDSVVIEWNADRDTLARALTYITDDLQKSNYYRRVLNYGRLDSIPPQDFIVNDAFFQTEKVVFGTGYDLKEGDTVYNAIFHIDNAYYDYIESVQLAVVANLNPFSQPASIKSNVTGTANPLGIFTCLIYDRDTTIVAH